MSEIMSLAPLLHSRISYFYDVYILRERKKNWAGREEKKRSCTSGASRGAARWVDGRRLRPSLTGLVRPVRMMRNIIRRLDWWRGFSLRFAGLPATITWREGCTSSRGCRRRWIKTGCWSMTDAIFLFFSRAVLFRWKCLHVLYTQKREGGRCVKTTPKKEEQHCDDLHGNTRFKNLSFCVYT